MCAVVSESNILEYILRSYESSQTEECHDNRRTIKFYWSHIVLVVDFRFRFIQLRLFSMQSVENLCRQKRIMQKVENEKSLHFKIDL